MEYQATAKYVRVSARKACLVADAIRSLTPEAAINQLALMTKSAAKPLAKVILSALANVKQKGGSVEGLRFKHIEIMGGPVMKRWHAVSKGQAHGYKKRMTHIRVVLTDEKREIKTT